MPEPHRSPYPPIPDEPVQEGARWRHHKPSSEQVAAWFATQPLDEGMDHASWVGGVVLIPQSEKVKYAKVDGQGTVERYEQVFTPYVQIGTRLAYFRRLGEQRGLIPHPEAVKVPRTTNPASPYFNANMPDGLWWHVVQSENGGPVRYLCATARVCLYDEQSYMRVLEGRPAMPRLVGEGTKQVSGYPDANGLMKAQTGAIGRALGVAGILVVGTGIACLPRRAEVLTRDGFRGCDEVEVGDDVLAYDAASDTTRWTPLRKVSVFGDAPVASVRSRSFSAICTADHKWAVRRKHVPASGPVFELREAQDLARGGPSLVLAASAESGSADLSPRDAAVLGWLATDGHIDYRVKRGSPRATITQSKPEHVQRLRDLLGADASERCVESGWQEIKGAQCWVRQRHDFRLHADAFRALKARARLERLEELPRVVSDLSTEARSAMLAAMRDADGWEVFTKGKRWVLDLFQMLCSLEGLALGAERPMAASAATQIRVRSSRFMDAAKVRLTPEFPEPVWCPTTDYGTWVARLDGQVFITGNSAEDMQEFVGQPAAAPQLPDPLPEGQAPPEVAQTPEGLRARALALSTQMQELPDEGVAWREFSTWWAERAAGEGWRGLSDVPDDAIVGIVSKLERDLEAAKANG